jgi:hypothetical protein
MLKVQKRSHDIDQEKGSGSDSEPKTNRERTPTGASFRANEPEFHPLAAPCPAK